MIGSRWTIVAPAAAIRPSTSAPGRKRAMTRILRAGVLSATSATSGETVGTAPGALGRMEPVVRSGDQEAAVTARTMLAAATVIQRQLAAAADGVWERAEERELTRTFWW